MTALQLANLVPCEGCGRRLHQAFWTQLVIRVQTGKGGGGLSRGVHENVTDDERFGVGGSAVPGELYPTEVWQSREMPRSCKRSAFQRSASDTCLQRESISLPARIRRAPPASASLAAPWDLAAPFADFHRRGLPEPRRARLCLRLERERVAGAYLFGSETFSDCLGVAKPYFSSR